MKSDRSAPPPITRIVFTGGPGGGKTTAADLFQREYSKQLVLVPETATLLYLAGFPRTDEPDAIRATQAAIFNVQRNLEEVQAAHFPGKLQICDRGSVDGAAYWPEGPKAFFNAVGTTPEQELNRYAAVFFFESAAVGGISIESGNRARTESIAQAASLDSRLRSLWSTHPRFHLIPHSTSFFHKIEYAMKIFHGLLRELKEIG
jgi:hypothetical protein